jgi:hypothetical protein
VVVVIALAAGTACSGTNDQNGDASTAERTSDLTVTRSLDRGGFVDAANRICSDPELGGDVGEPVGSNSSVEQIDAQAGAIDGRVRLLQELPVPDGDAEVLARIERSYERVLTALDALRSAVEDDDGQAAVIVASALDGLRAETNRLAADYGIEACAI